MLAYRAFAKYQFSEGSGPSLYSQRTTCSYTELSKETLVTSIFYSIFNNENLNFRLGDRPKHLNGGRVPNRKEQRKFETYKTRRQRSPIVVAKDYKQQFNKSDYKSIRAFARTNNLDWSMVAKHLKLLTLPSDILTFLENNQSPEVLSKCHLKYLYSLTTLQPEKANQKFAQMMCKRTVLGLSRKTASDSASNDAITTPWEL